MMSDFGKLTDFLDKQAIKQREELAEWNRENTPLAEATQHEETIGVFNLDDKWYFGTKKKFGYDPRMFVEVPTILLDTYAKSRLGLL